MLTALVPQLGSFVLPWLLTHALGINYSLEIKQTCFTSCTNLICIAADGLGISPGSPLSRFLQGALFKFLKGMNEWILLDYETFPWRNDTYEWPFPHSEQPAAIASSTSRSFTSCCTNTQIVNCRKNSNQKCLFCKKLIWLYGFESVHLYSTKVSATPIRGATRMRDPEKIRLSLSSKSMLGDTLLEVMEAWGPIEWGQWRQKFKIMPEEIWAKALGKSFQLWDKEFKLVKWAGWGQQMNEIAEVFWGSIDEQGL